MTTRGKLKQKILEGRSDTAIGFDELCLFLYSMGFQKRVKGSHHIFRKEGVYAKINLQRDGAKAKAYQIRQIRSIMLEYSLTGDE